MLYEEGEPCDQCREELNELQTQLATILNNSDTPFVNKITAIMMLLHDSMVTLNLTYGQIIDHMNWVFDLCESDDVSRCTVEEIISSKHNSGDDSEKMN